MRAFIAIDLPESVRQGLAQAQDRLRAVCTEARWARPEGIHLTLKFLDQISSAQVAQVTRALAAIGPFVPFPVRVRGFGFFPAEGRPRVFWAGIEAPDDLGQLAARVESALTALGFAAEDRAFSPHLTLARFKVPRPQPRLQAVLREPADSDFGAFEVAEFFLWESKLAPQGAQYQKVARFPRPPAADIS